MDETTSGDSITAARCKAEFLRRIDQVARTHRTLTVTKRGRPTVRIVPIEPEDIEIFGALHGIVTSANALTEPSGETWDAEE